MTALSDTPVTPTTARPFLHVLELVRDLGRDRRDSDPEFVAVAKKAHAVLAWFEADSEGALDRAQKHLDAVYSNG